MRERGFSRFIVFVMLTCTSACAPGSTRYPDPVQTPPGDEAEIVWPAPPYPPKIAYVTMFRGTADFGTLRSFWERLGRLAGVSRDEAFVRPTGVAARGELLAIADPGKAALFLVDRTARRHKKIDEGRDGPLASPVGVAISRQDIVYLSDSATGRIHLFSRDGRPLSVWGGDELERPSGLAIDDTLQRLYVVDTARHRVVVYGLDGKVAFTFGRHGPDPGAFNWPSHVYVARDGNVFVVDSLNFRVQIFDSDGRFLSTFGRAGNTSGDIARPKGIASDSNGNLYVVDALFDSVQIFDRAGQLLLSFGGRGVRRGQFWLPTGLAITRDDTIYVADSYNHRIQVFRFLAGN